MTTDQTVNFASAPSKFGGLPRRRVYAQAVWRGCPPWPWPIRLGLAYGVRQLAVLLCNHCELLPK